MKYLIGNHKMNLSHKELKEYFKNLKKATKQTTNYVGVCVPSVYLPLANKMLKGSKIKHGAQNVWHEPKGAYTGELSTAMLKDYACDTVIVGHSERRSIFNESDELINKKIVACLNANLTPIFCFGETMDQKNDKQTKKVLKSQITKGLKNIDPSAIYKMFFAYEPVWAIGTGLSATAKEAEDSIKYVKDVIAKHFGLSNTKNIVVLYGGSLNAKNVDELLGMPSIDGGLIGGASLKVEDFEKLVAYGK